MKRQKMIEHYNIMTKIVGWTSPGTIAKKVDIHNSDNNKGSWINERKFD